MFYVTSRKENDEEEQTAVISMRTVIRRSSILFLHSHQLIAYVCESLEVIALSIVTNSFYRMTTHLPVWIINFTLLFSVLHGLDETCRHIQSKGERCTLGPRSVLKGMIISPTAKENEECKKSCIQAGYLGGGYCSISKDCFRFCSCHHSVVNSSLNK